MMNIAVCDDNPEHIKYTVSLIRQELNSYEVDIESFTSADRFLCAVRQDHYCADLAVLDIEIGEENGIDLAEELNALLPACRIIFLTGFANYISESYRARHVWFVLKSDAEKYLGAALRRAIDDSELPDRPIGINVHIHGKRFLIPLSDILYIERYDRKTRIVCNKNVYSLWAQPAALINENIASCFVRCHQGYWVNLRQVSALERNCFVLKSGDRLPIGRTFQESARKRFFEQLRILN